MALCQSTVVRCIDVCTTMYMVDYRVSAITIKCSSPNRAHSLNNDGISELDSK